MIVSCVTVLGMLASIHELFDNNEFVDDERYTLVKQKMHDHEQYTNTAVLYLLVIEGVMISVASLILTEKMNIALNRNILFLRTMDGNRNAKRIRSYERLQKFNISTVFVDISALGLQLSQHVYAELKAHQRERSWNEHSEMDWITALMELCSCLQLIVFPLLAMVYLPVYRELQKELKKKILCKSENSTEQQD